jgi:predicted Zn-dependent protease
VLEVLYLTRQADPTLEGLLGKHESNMLSYLWNGQRSQHAGQLADAARAYSRALLSSRFQAEAQLGLLTSLLALADKDTPKTAVELLNDILRDHGMDPAALLAYAEVNRRLDNLQGHDSMEAALAYLERLLAPAQQNAVAADLLARGYYAAGRADLARAEAARALQLNASYAPALALAARLAFEDGEYETCQRYAEDLERALYGMRSAKPVLGPVSRPSPAAGPQSVVDRPQPTLMDGAYWRAVAADRLGHKEEARRIYQNLVTQHPNLAVGYLGLAGLSEQAKDLTGALHYAQQWRAQDAQDAAGAAAEVRLLAKAGKTDDAERVGKAYAEGNAAALVTVARAFAAAGAYDQAEAWARRAVQAARDKADVVAAHLAVGDACKARALSKMGDARRADVDKALAAYKQVWTLMPGQSAAGYAMAYLQATERSNESEAAYAVAQDARTGRYSQRLLGGDRLTLEQLDVLAAVYRASKHAGDSVTLFREALKRYPQEPMVHLHLGLAYRDQNMPRDAVATLTAAQTAALEKADAATDAAQKTHWQAVAEQAKAECEKLVAKSQ